jgi:hypothetical protein
MVNRWLIVFDNIGWKSMIVIDGCFFFKIVNMVKMEVSENECLKYRMVPLN